MSNIEIQLQRKREISEYLESKARLKDLLSRSIKREFEIEMLSDNIKRFESRLDFAKIQAEIEADIEKKRAKLFDTMRAERKAKLNRPITRSNIYPGTYYEVWVNGDLYLECTECSADAGNCSCWSC